MGNKLPEHIDLVYRKVGDVHVFASKGIKGMIHVGHDDLKTAYDNVLEALHTHVQKAYGVEARYRSASGFDDLQTKANDSPLVVFPVVIDAQDAVCH